MSRENANQTRIKEFYALQGWRLWRNNSGVAREKDEETGKKRFVRYGLANESPELKEILKSGDLIGWHPRLITPDMVGDVIAQFVSVEVKKTGWTMPSDEAMGDDAKRCRAQLLWAQMVREEGGIAGFMIDPLKGFERW